MKLLCYILLYLTPCLAYAGTITLPLKFHIMQDIVMQNKGQSMKVLVTEQEIRGQVLTEINRIWKQADIQWSIEDVVSENSINIPNKTEQLNFVSNTGRDAEGSYDKASLPILYSMINGDNFSHSSFNIYIFPFIGNTLQGISNPQENIIIIGAWSNKSSRGIESPLPASVVEPEPFKKGSMSRTIAHELGHMLSLQHPDKATQTGFNRLMGGKMPGYIITKDEVNQVTKEVSNVINKLK